MVRSIVIGATSDAGAELVALLHAHPYADLAGLFDSGKGLHGPQESPASAPGTPFSTLFPRHRGQIELPLQPLDSRAILEHPPRAAFLTTPPEVAHDLATSLLEQGVTVFDLSGAFTLGRPDLHRRYHGWEHRHTDWLEKAVYGIPELSRQQLRLGADLIAVAGAAATSVNLALRPLVAAGALERDRRPVVDSIAGLSEPRREPGEGRRFGAASLQPYDVFCHRQKPEIDLHAGVEVIFTPHVAAFERGILSTLHVELARDWLATAPDGPAGPEGLVRGILAQAYGQEPFVRLLPQGSWPTLRDCLGTPFCDIACAVEPDSPHLVVVAALDNLLKGAAGQAVQCFNTVFGYPEHTGLLAQRI